MRKGLKNGLTAANPVRAARPKTAGVLAQPVDAANAGFAAKHPLRILVVDDNALNLKVIATLLRGLGYEPALFREAAATLEELRATKYDLVLMDVQMPGMDGHEATRQLRAGAAGELNRATPVIALTANQDLEDRLACLAAGMDDCLIKPPSLMEVQETLAEIARDAG